MKTYILPATCFAILAFGAAAGAQACYSPITSWQGGYNLDASGSASCSGGTCTISESAAADVNANSASLSCAQATWSGTDNVTSALVNNKAVIDCLDGTQSVETIIGNGVGNSTSIVIIRPLQGTYQYFPAPFADSVTQIIDSCDGSSVTQTVSNAGLFPPTKFPLTFPLPATVQELTASPPPIDDLVLIELAMAPYTFSFSLVPVYTEDCDCEEEAGSTIGTQNQSLGEDVPVAGTGFTLHYEGSRSKGTGGNPTAITDAAMIGGWTLSVHHAYDPATNTLFLGNGTQRNGYQIGTPISFSGNTLITSEEGDEVYVFNAASRRHLQTLRPMTGAIEYRFGYDAAGELITVTDARGNVTRIQRDGSGRPTAIVSPFGQTTMIGLDSNGFLTQVTDPLGMSETFTNSPAGLVTIRTDPNGNTYNYTYEATGRLIKDADPIGGFTGLTRTKATSGLGSTVGLNSAMGVSSSSQNSVQIPWIQDGSALYSDQRTVTWQDGLQATDNQSQQGNQRSEAVTIPGGTSYSATYGPDPVWGLQFPVITNETLTKGNLTMNVSGSRSATLGTVGNPFSVSSMTQLRTVNGHTFTSTYTASNHTYVNTSAVGRTLTIKVDALERVTSAQVAGLTATTFLYDSRGRVSSSSRGARKTSFTYGTDGYVASVTDPLARTTSFAYDSDGRVLSKTLPDSRTINFSYDANGNLTSVTPPGQSAHDFTYTPVNLTASYVPPAVVGTGSISYGYDLDGNLTTVTRPDSQTIHFGYDSAGRLISIGTPTGISSFTYSSLTGNLATAGRGNQHVSYSYNGPLPTKSTWKGTVAGTVSETYNNTFRAASQNVSGGSNIVLQHDNDGMLIKSGNMRITRNRTNGLITSTAFGVTTDTLSHNTFGELIAYTASANGAPVYTAQYTRDADGRVTAKAQTLGAAANNYFYSYDLAGRLTTAASTAGTDSYTYNLNSDRLSATTASGTANATYDAQDRLLTYGNASFTYTASGELTSQKIGTQKTFYKYDVLGNLILVTLPNATKIAYVIDAENRRVGKLVNGVLTTGFLYDNDSRVVAQLNGVNQLVSQFVYATGSSSPDYMISGGVSYRIFSDQLGSPVLVVNTATGAIAEQLSFDEFGNVLIDSTPGFQPFGFAGGLYDQDTKFLRFGARDYNPAIGRWTTKDPVSFDGGDSNLYGYVFEDPVNLTDPSGLDGAVLNLTNPGATSSNGVNITTNLSSYHSPDGTLTVVAHGSPGQVLGKNGKPMTAQELAKAILHSSEWNTGTYKKIRLLICHSATAPKNGKSIRDQLQRELRGAADVEAPDTRVGIDGNGNPVAVGEGKGAPVNGPAVFLPAQ